MGDHLLKAEGHKVRDILQAGLDLELVREQIQPELKLYEVIHQRYERGSIILTSNRSPSEWPELFGDSVLASAALDRLTHHARVTIITGESYRQKERRKGARKAETEPEITEG